ncbi:MAG: nickel/cobalt transporter [Methyloceanibacter sp.]|uniref:nickel/cobalt transporter n=1 Tax=Methyloceanibacter sp. TaxID=1965321 RepID=UPI003D6D2AF0
MIALFGLYLLTTELRRLWWRRQERKAGRGAGHHDHSHHAHAHHDHGHDHAHGEACNHIVDARDVAGPLSWRKIAAVVVSVGIRPCSGAILVLVFALTQGLFWAGVAATFAMALGTAITVAVLATLALGSRELALRLGGESRAWTEAVWTTCAIGGAVLVLTLGLLLFAASLGPARPF